MKLFIFSLLLALVTSTSGYAAEKPVKKMFAYCNYVDHEDRYLEADIYSANESEDSELVLADITVFKIEKESGKKLKELAHFQLPYVKPAAGLSLIMKFSDESLDTTLDIFGDDMGGMSSLQLGKKEFVLTCGVEDQE